MRTRVAAAERAIGDVGAQADCGTPAEERHIGMLAEAIGGDIVVHCVDGRGWRYEATRGNGGSAHVMWDGHGHFVEMLKEAVERAAREALHRASADGGTSGLGAGREG